jgi:uncharacterized OB-fold protein
VTPPARRLLPADVAPDELDAPFWDGCRRGEFLLHRCQICGRVYWPATACIEHGGASMAWVPGSGRGTVHTYTVFHQPFDPSLADRIPYAIAAVALDEGPFFLTDLVECDPEDVHVGMPVEAVYERIDEAVSVPHFRPSRP